MEGMLLTSIPLFKHRVIRAAAHQLLDCVHKSVRQIQSHCSNSSSLKDQSRLEKIEEIGGKDFDAYLAPSSTNNGLISGFKTISNRVIGLNETRPNVDNTKYIQTPTKITG